MGTVIAFPHDRRVGRIKGLNAQSEPADVVILPVVRIERAAASSDVSKSGTRVALGRRRKRRATNSYTAATK